MRKKCLVLIILLGTTCAVQAVPQTIRFQGRLTNSDGMPIIGTPEVSFGLFDVASGGTSLWETAGLMTVQTNEAGLFSTELGPIPVSVFSDNDNLFLEISVRGTSGLQVLGPRQKLSSVAFSFSSHHAETAETAQTIGNDSVTSQKIQDGEIQSQDIGQGEINSALIEDGGVQLIDLGPGSVNSEKIQDGEVNRVDLAPDAVHSDNIEDESIRDLDLAPDAVGTSELQNQSVTNEKIGLDAVKTENILDGEVHEGDLQDDAVSTAKIAPGAVASEAIGPQSINNGHLSSEVSSHLIPSGMIGLFNRECPSTWSRFSALDNRFPMGGPSAGNLGGSNAHNHPIPSQDHHNHSGSTQEESVISDRVLGAPPGQPNNELLWNIGIVTLLHYVRHNHAISADGRHDHGGNTLDRNSLPPYRTVVFCQKD